MCPSWFKLRKAEVVASAAETKKTSKTASTHHQTSARKRTPVPNQGEESLPSQQCKGDSKGKKTKVFIGGWTGQKEVQMWMLFWLMHKSSSQRRVVQTAWGTDQTMQQQRMYKPSPAWRSFCHARGKGQTMQQWRMHKQSCQWKSVNKTLVKEETMQQRRMYKPS